MGKEKFANYFVRPFQYLNVSKTSTISFLLISNFDSFSHSWSTAYLFSIICMYISTYITVVLSHCRGYDFGRWISDVDDGRNE